jgi:hypothetical protein
VARRALEARGLVQEGDRGQMLVHRALLTAVGVCAFPQQTTLVEHWAAGAEADATRFFAHSRGDDSVVHSIDSGGHTFVLLSSQQELVDHVAAACKWNGARAASSMELTVGRQDFTRACDASATGATADALQVLTGATGNAGASYALAHTLASNPRISIVQTFRPGPDGPDGADQEQSFTVIEGDGQVWLIAPVTEAADAPLQARTVSGAEITALLQGR